MARSSSVRKRFQKSVKRSGHQRLWGKDVLLIDRMSREGRGIASRDGKIVFVSGALEGERVLVQCTTVKRDYDEAQMLALESGAPPSLSRVEPPCPLYAECGGCTLQHWSLPAQQEHKRASLLAMLQQISPRLTLHPDIAGPASGYRHRLRLSVLRRRDERWSLGMKMRASQEVIALSDCLVANPTVNRLIKALPPLLDKAPQLQGLREIEIDSDSIAQVGLCCYFAARPGEKAIALLRAAVWTAPVTSLRVRLIEARKSRQDGTGDDEGEDRTSWQELHSEGELRLSLQLSPSPSGLLPASRHNAPIELRYLPGDFTQINWSVNAALVERAIDWLQPGADEAALDLFSGIGNFSLPLAARARTVHALEGDSRMTERLISNAALNGMDNVTAGTLDLMRGQPALPRADIAIVDPPRAGAKAVCEILAGTGVKRLVYVSCHPATLVRDAGILQAAGFTIGKAAAVDMFPHTGHSEAIVLFQRTVKRP